MYIYIVRLELDKIITIFWATCMIMDTSNRFELFVTIMLSRGN